MLTPIIPFEPVSTDDPPQGKNWIGQVKWDGVRVLTYFDGQKTKLYNRRQNERTDHYPELTNTSTYCAAKSIILDGEVIALDTTGKPSFHDVMRRDGLRRMERVEQVRQHVPISYMIFDVLYVNGAWVHQYPLEERQKLLSENIQPGETVQLVPSHQNLQNLLQVTLAHDLEGIVVKDLYSKYVLNGKSDRWQKIKHYQDLYAVVGGVTFRDGIVNALLLGLYDDQMRLWYVGHAGTGKLKKSEWRVLTEAVKGMIIRQRPFENRPERHRDAVWIKPQLTVKIKFLEWTKSKTLRQPSIQSFVQAKAEQCTFHQS